MGYTYVISLVTSISYVFVYSIILNARTRRGLVRPAQFQYVLDNVPAFALVGACEAIGFALGISAASNLPGGLISVTKCPLHHQRLNAQRPSPPPRDLFFTSFLAPPPPLPSSFFSLAMSGPAATAPGISAVATALSTPCLRQDQRAHFLPRGQTFPRYFPSRAWHGRSFFRRSFWEGASLPCRSWVQV